MCSEQMVTPFKGNFLDDEYKVSNYRISRARKSIENTFGMLESRYELFSRPRKVSVAHCKSIVLCCTALQESSDGQGQRYSRPGRPDKALLKMGQKNGEGGWFASKRTFPDAVFLRIDFL